MPTETTLSAILAMAVFGFTGSLHCAAMCGSLAATGCAPGPGAALQYHVARIAAYATLGFTAGLLGAMLVAGRLESGGRPLGVLFGGLMAAHALLELWRLTYGARSRAPSRLTAVGRRAHRWVTSLPFPRSITLGLATALLPCGFLLAALLQAALLAHPLASAAAMIVFALASSPALLAAAGVLAVVRRRAPRAAPIGAALLLLVAAGVIVWRSLSPPHEHPQDHHEHHRPQLPAAPTEGG